MDKIAAVYINIDELIPNPNNPRREQPIEEVAKSIKNFGFGAPIVARKENNMIIAGHTRYFAAKDLGTQYVPCRFMDISQQDAIKLALADNKIGELARWEDEKLKNILLELEQETEISDLGWTDEELDILLEELKEEPIQENLGPIEENKFDDLPQKIETITKDGDVITIGDHVLHCGDCIEVLKKIDDNYIDAIVCDPPYGIGFMAKGWDCSVPSEDWAKECLRVLKPGGHIVAFGATRTIHRLTVAIEDAGFEIRDQIAWCYFSGFPKSHDVSKAISTEEAKQFDGYGTALKPAYEPAVLARKPLTEKNIAENVLEWGTGGINIDNCRFGYGDPCWVGPQESIRDPRASNGIINPNGRSMFGAEKLPRGEDYAHQKGRWPANLYQCPKASRKEREEGCEELHDQPYTQGAGAGGWKEKNVKNIHPTVKPVRLMRWLCRLLAPPKDPIILDTFCGSGTTLIAAELEGFRSIGIERQPEYCDIIRARLTNQCKVKK